MIRALAGGLLAAAATAAVPCAPLLGQNADASALLDSFRSNVVRVEAGGMLGFGFVVGLEGRDLLIATAHHTLDHDAGDQPNICFPIRGETCDTGTLWYIADPVGASPRLDLAIVAVPYPDGLRWRPDVVAPDVSPGDPVWTIGRALEWYISPEPGTVTGRTPERHQLRYRDLAVARGVSGAPVVTSEGFVAMHVQSEGTDGEAHGVELEAIRERVVDHLRAPWVLLPRATCDDAGTPGRLLMGGSVSVHFDPARPQAALRAIARLHCLGMRAQPLPVWEPGSWEGSGIVYPSGGLRTARSLQSVLAPLDRLETRLGEPAAGDASIWIR